MSDRPDHRRPDHQPPERTGAHHRQDPIDPDLPVPGDRLGVDRRSLKVYAAVALGGAIGAPLRYEIGLALPAGGGAFPVATFLINISGSFVLGVLVTLIAERWPPTTYVRPFAATGVLGAYTTWSTFMVDTNDLAKAGHVAMAAGYVGATLAAGLVAAYAGIRLVRAGGPRPATVRSGR
jgi:CrcB protein